MPKIDRRIRRTRAAFSQALLALILEKPYESITIQEIADCADLNRATFYLHYGSKEELLMDSLESQFDDLVQRLQAEVVGLPWESPMAARILFDYVAENEALFRILLGPGGQGYVMYRILAYIADYDERLLRQLFVADSLAIPIPILSRHFAGSLYALLLWWLENGRPYSSLEMAQMLQRLCTLGVNPIFNGGEVQQSLVTGTNYHLEPPTPQLGNQRSV